MRLSGEKLLRIDGLILSGISVVALLSSVLGFSLAAGKFSFLAQNELAAIGFIEAYGLAFLLGLALMGSARQQNLIFWHQLGASTHAFLFTVNVSFWHMYQTLDLVPAGWLATAFHLGMAGVQLFSARIPHLRRGV